MNTGVIAVRVCRACGQRSLSSLRPNAPASHTTIQPRPSSRAISSASIRRIQPAADTLPSDASPSPLPESLLPGTAPPPTSSSKTQHERSPNPYPQIPLDVSLRLKTGTVTRIHAATATITLNAPRFDKHLRKYFNHSTHDLVHDPLSLLRVGDVIQYSAFTSAEAASREARKEEIYEHLEQKGVQTGRGEYVTRKGFVVPEGKRLVMVGAKLESIPRKQRGWKGVKLVCRGLVSPFGEGVGEREGVKKGWLVDFEREQMEEREGGVMEGKKLGESEGDGRVEEKDGAFVEAAP